MTPYAIAAMAITYVTTIVSWTFVIMYHVLSRGAWRHDPMGRHLMALGGVDAAIFTMLTVASLWPVLALQPWFQWSYLATVAGIAVVTAWRVAILWRRYHPAGLVPVVAPRRHRRPVRHPFLAWQIGLAAAQVVNGKMLGSLTLAVLLGAAQLVMVSIAYGRATPRAPAVVESAR